MRLQAWNNACWGRLPWYQPVSRLHPLGTALAVHPADKCVDGITRQPIIAIRRYGRGEVVYLWDSSARRGGFSPFQIRRAVLPATF